MAAGVECDGSSPLIPVFNLEVERSQREHQLFAPGFAMKQQFVYFKSPEDRARVQVGDGRDPARRRVVFEATLRRLSGEGTVRWSFGEEDGVKSGGV